MRENKISVEGGFIVRKVVEINTDFMERVINEKRMGKIREYEPISDSQLTARELARLVGKQLDTGKQKKEFYGMLELTAVNEGVFIPDYEWFYRYFNGGAARVTMYGRKSRSSRNVLCEYRVRIEDISTEHRNAAIEIVKTRRNNKRRGTDGNGHDENETDLLGRMAGKLELDLVTQIQKKTGKTIREVISHIIQVAYTAICTSEGQKGVGNETGSSLTKSLTKDLTKSLTKDLTKSLTKNQEKIMHEIAKNPQLTSKKLSRIVGIAWTTVRENLRQLKAEHAIKRIGSKRKGYWKIAQRVQHNSSVALQRTDGPIE